MHNQTVETTQGSITFYDFADFERLVAAAQNDPVALLIVHLSPSAVQSAIRLLEQPAPVRHGDNVETAAKASGDVSKIKGKVVSLNFASWNQLHGWLRQVERLRSAA